VLLKNESDALNSYFLWILDSVVSRCVIIVKHGLARMWKAEIQDIFEIENTNFGITSSAADIPTDAVAPTC
jgi:hypothetical protein